MRVFPLPSVEPPSSSASGTSSKRTIPWGESRWDQAPPPEVSPVCPPRDGRCRQATPISTHERAGSADLILLPADIRSLLSSIPASRNSKVREPHEPLPAPHRSRLL